MNIKHGAVYKTLTMVMLAFAFTSVTTPVFAYMLDKGSDCNSGRKWDVSRPVKVRLLGDSALDYLNNRGGGSSLADLARMDRDIKGVIDLYNSVAGSRLVLEQDTGISGDSDLEEPEADNYGTQTIVIGFTSRVAKSSSTAEAWASPVHNGCVRTRVHIQFRKDYNWIFGPPDTTDVDGRAFYTSDQPNKAGSATPRTFLGILTHEMGHAIGLKHPDNNYAVMAQAFRTWFRGPDHILHTGLLPDDTAGVLALYGTTGTRVPLDISVTNSWYKSAEAQFSNCTTQIAKVDAAAQAVSDATGLPVDGQFPADVIFKGEHADLFDALARAQDELRACEDAKNAMQVDNCKVSSRGDTWTGKLTGVGAYCGVNNKNSTYATVSNKVCPGKQIQLRYTLNNHTKLQDVLVKSEVWFSRDTTLNARDGNDVKSRDIRKFTIKAGSSSILGQVFRLPAKAPNREELYVFVRAIPYDVKTGASLWDSDVDKWNNAIMTRKSIKVDRSVCP